MESRFGPEGIPDAIRTSLGWVLFSPTILCQCCSDVGNDSDTDTFVRVILSENAKVDPNFPPHEYEINCGLDHDNSREDRLAHKIMKDSIKILRGHFQLPLLWRCKNVFLPDNRAMAQKRLESLKRRLSKENRYTKNMQLSFKIISRKVTPKMSVMTVEETFAFGFCPITKLQIRRSQTS